MQQQSLTSNKSLTSQRSLTLSPPLHNADLTAKEFCKKASLKHEWVNGLTALGFSMMANLDDVSEADWFANGFKILDVRRIKCAFKSVRKELRKASN